MAENLIVDAVEAAVPGGAEVKAGIAVAKSIGPIVMWALIGLVLLLGLNTVFGFITDPFGWKAGHLAKVEAQAAQDHGGAIVAAGQSSATSDAGAISDRGAQRDSLSITLHEANDHALQATPGASAPIDPALNAVGRRGLCGHASYATDPSCAGLRISGPDPLPSAGSGNPAPGGNG